MPISQRVTGSRPERSIAHGHGTLSERASSRRTIVLASRGRLYRQRRAVFRRTKPEFPTRTTGIQNAVTGFFSGMRVDAYLYAYISAGYARDLFYFVCAAPSVLTIPRGLVPVAPGNFFFNDTWDNEYLTIRQANAILTSLASGPGSRRNKSRRFRASCRR